MATSFRGRRVGPVAGLIVLISLLTAVILHTPPVRVRALELVIARLTDAGYVAHADRLDYNIFTLTLRMSGVTVAVPSRPATPFLAAREIRVSLPWAAIRGRFGIDRVEIVSPRVTLRRDASGRDNWTPGPHDTTSTGLLSVHIGRAIASDVVIDWADDQSESHVDAALSFDLTTNGRATVGPIATTRPLAVRWRDRATSIVASGGRLSWNDRDLAIEGLSLRAPEGTVRVDGRVEELLGAARMDARLTAVANLTAVSPWLNLRRPVAGTVHATTHADGAGVDISNLRANVAGGEVTGEGRVSFDGNGFGRLKWVRLDLPEILQHVLEDASDVRPSSRIDGNLDARWTGPRLEDLQLTTNSRFTGERVPGRRRELPVDATIALALRHSRWKMSATSVDALGLHATATLEGTVDALDFKSSPIAGTISARTIDDRGWPLALVRAGLLEAEPSVQGPVTGEFVVRGSIGAPLLDGNIDTTLRYPSLPDSHIRGRVSLTPGAIALDNIDARISGSTAAGMLSWSSASNTIGGALTGVLRLEDLADFVPTLPESAALDGSLDLSAALTGSLARPRIAIRGSGRALDLAGQTIDRVTMDARLDGRELTVDRVLAESEGGQLEASAIVDLARETYTTKVTATDVPIHPMLDAANGERDAPVSGRVSGTFEGAGSFQQLGGHGRVSISAARWRSADIGHVSGDVTLSGRTATFAVEARDVALEGRGSVALDAGGPLSVSGRWEPSDVATVAQRMSVALPVSGSAALGLAWNGPRDRIIENGRGQLRVDRADIVMANQKFSLVQPGRIEADANVISVSPIVVETGASRLTIDGALGSGRPQDTLALTLDGSLADFGFIRDLVQTRAEGASEPPPLVGSIHARLTASGTAAAPRISGALQIRGGRLPVNDRAQIGDIELGARYDEGVIVVDRATAAFEGASVAATARIPSEVFIDRLPQSMRGWIVTANGPGTLSAQLRSITPSVLAPFVDAATLEQIALNADASIDLEADRPELERLRGAITLSRAELSLAGVALDQQTTTRVAIGTGRATVDAWNWGRAENHVALAGSMGLSADPTLDLTATAALDLRLLNALVPAARTLGRADTQIHVGGTVGVPTIDGYMTIGDGETRMANPRLVVGDVAGTVTLADDRLTLERVSATVNGGDAELTGSIRHRWLSPVGGSVTFTAKGSALDISGVRAEADAALTWTLDPNSPTLGGSITLLRSAYREQLSVASNVLAALRRSSAPVQTSGASGMSLLDRTRLDVRLLTDEDLVIDNNVARLSVHGDLRAVGSAASPSLTGRMGLGEGGSVFFNGTRYRLSDRRSIDFANTNRIEPDLDLSAVARVQGEDITVSLKGTPATLETTLESDNKNLSQSDLVSLLLVGRKASEGATPGGDELVGLLTGNFLEAAGRAVGFDTARVERGTSDFRFDAGLVGAETDPGTRLTFGKSIGSHVELVFSQSLQQSGGLTWIVGYKPRSGIDLRFVTLDEGDRLYMFSHDITVGNRAQMVSAPAGPAARVSDITIIGAGTDEAALRSRLKLTTNDRFSFFQWQDDRERLESFYQERQHLEVRIVTRRIAEPADATRIRLVYDIRPGPRTTIIVDGYSLSKPAIAAIERSWTRAVVDDFLIEEVATIVRAELADAGYLLPTVTARLEDSADARQLRVTVVTGSHVSDRRVEFSGNANQPSERLLAVLADRVLTRAVWTNPDAVRNALTAFYRSNGYLNAVVGVESISIEQHTAIRPITVVEGDAFQVGEVRIEGVRAFTREEAAQLVGLASGDPYRVARLEAAQIALDTQYRARGFNRVAIDYHAAVAPGTPEVAVLVRVDEGPQQRLREIATNGLERTNSSLLSRALLELKIGEPVDLAAWNAARRRAYETGAFRTVDIQREVLMPAEPPSTGSEPAAEAVKATVTVQEWPPLRVRYGVEVRDQLNAAGDAARENSPDTERGGGRTFGLGLAADLGARGLFGRAVSAGVAGRYATNARVARAYVTSPLFFGRPIASTAFIERSHEEFGAQPRGGLAAFETIKTDVTLEQRIRLARRTTLSYGYTRERNHTRRLDPDPLDPNPFDLTETIGNFTTAAIVDARDDPIDATHGWFHSSSLQYAPPVGSTQRFVRYFMQTQLFRRADRVVFATAARVGLARGLGLPLVPSKRFFAGGGNSVRGYAEDVLSPTDFFGAAVGGNALVVVNQEVRFPIFKAIRGVGFFDAGRAFEGVGSLSLGALATSAGLGLRVQTPFVLLRMDVGVPFDTTVGPRHPRWFFSIGQMF